MGLMLTTLILTAPPMAALFFQGTLGAFSPYSQIAGSPIPAAPGPQGQRPGSYTPPQSRDHSSSTTTQQVQTTMPRSAVDSGPTQDPNAMGLGTYGSHNAKK